MDDNILIVAGEPSGDIRAGELVKELKPMIQGIDLWGIGGDALSAQGVELVEHINNLSIVGVLEVIKKLPSIRKQYRDLTRQILLRKPRMAVLVDYPGFNLKIAAFLSRQGIPVVYYVIPQVWAWGSGRIKTIKKNVSKALVLFGFEKDLLEKSGIPCEFVGHPILDVAPPVSKDPQEDIRGNGPTVALLPGSRKSEVSTLLPIILAASKRLAADFPRAGFIIAKSSNVDSSFYEPVIEKYTDLDLSVTTDDTFAALERSDFAIVASGTATLETAVMEVPMVIVYRTHLLTYLLAKPFVRTPFLGLANIIAGREIAPELLWRDFTADNLYEKISEILSNPDLMNKSREDLRKIKSSLGNKGAARKAALAVKNCFSEFSSMPGR